MGAGLDTHKRSYGPADYFNIAAGKITNPGQVPQMLLNPTTKPNNEIVQPTPKISATKETQQSCTITTEPKVSEFFTLGMRCI